MQSALPALAIALSILAAGAPHDAHARGITAAIGAGQTLSIGAASVETAESYNPESLSRTVTPSGAPARPGNDVAIESMEIAHEGLDLD